MDRAEDPVTTIGESLPCVRCGYDLRGLREDGRCPECGARIKLSLHFVNERVMCPACMAPNHPSVAVCSNCKSPIQNAAALANYFRPAPLPMRRHASNEPEELEVDDEPEAPPKPMSPALLAGFYAIGVPAVVAGIAVIGGVIAEGPYYGEPAMQFGQRVMLIALFMGVPVAVGAALVFFPTRRFVNERRAAKSLDQTPRESA